MPRSPCLVHFPDMGAVLRHQVRLERHGSDEARSGRTRAVARARRVFLKSTLCRAVQIGPHETGSSLRSGIEVLRDRHNVLAFFEPLAT